MKHDIDPGFLEIHETTVFSDSYRAFQILTVFAPWIESFEQPLQLFRIDLRKDKLDFENSFELFPSELTRLIGIMVGLDDGISSWEQLNQIWTFGICPKDDDWRFAECVAHARHIPVGSSRRTLGAIVADCYPHRNAILEVVSYVGRPILVASAPNILVFAADPYTFEESFYPCGLRNALVDWLVDSQRR